MADAMKIYKRRKDAEDDYREAEAMPGTPKDDALAEVMRMMEKAKQKPTPAPAPAKPEPKPQPEQKPAKPSKPEKGEGGESSEDDKPEDLFHRAVVKVVESEDFARTGDVSEAIEAACREVAEEVDAKVEAAIKSLPSKPAEREVVVVGADEPDAEGKPSEEVYTDVHELFAPIVKCIDNGDDFLLIGPAGCGKTHLMAMAAAACKRQYGSLSCSSGMSKSELAGWLLPHKDGGFGYVGTEFVRIVEEGGVFGLDEIDAADANGLLILNQLLANGSFPIPARYANPVAKRHERFVLGAAANTFGRGANRMYVGRNQLDEATLDRFACNIFEMDYDRKLETKLVTNEGVRDLFWKLRTAVETHKLRRIVSTRAMLKAQKVIAGGRETLGSVRERFLAGWTEEERSRVGFPKV